jgi:hypothetical protein
MPVEGGAGPIRDNLRSVEGESKVEGFEVYETVTAREAQLFVERSCGILHKSDHKNIVKHGVAQAIPPLNLVRIKLKEKRQMFHAS